MQLVYQVCYTRCEVLFYLSQIRPSLNHYRVPKYFDQDCLKISFLLPTLPIVIQIYEKCAYVAQGR